MIKKYDDVTKQVLAVAVLLTIFSISGLAQSKERVLIFTGGHEFEREAFFNIFRNMSNTEYKEVVQPAANQLYDSDMIDDFDVLVFYDMVQEISESQKLAFINLLKQGKGVLFLHHSLVSYQHWDEFEKIIGGRYILSDDETKASNYKHDEYIPVKIIDKSHPVTKGLDGFTIRDEVYGNYRVSSTVNPLLSTTHPESSEIIGWTNDYGNSKIIYLELGHDHFAYNNPNYRRLIKKSIDWISKE